LLARPDLALDLVEAPAARDLVAELPDRLLVLGRAGEVWGAESGNDRLVVLRY